MGNGYALYRDRLDKRLYSLKSVFISLILCFAAVAVVLGIEDYLRARSVYIKYQAQKGDIAVLQKEIEARDAQLQTLSGKLRMLDIRLVELNRFEDKLRNLAGFEYDAGQFFHYGAGTGGEILRGIDPEDSEWHRPENLAKYLDDRLEQLSESTRVRSRTLQELYEIFKVQKEILTVTPSIRPVEEGWISSGFGYRKSPFSGREEFHTGVDIAVQPGTPVRATADGIVNFAGSLGSFGKIVTVDHGFGITSRYCHLNKVLTSKGQSVKKGDVIAETGNTGRSTGPHIHYEVRFNGIPMNAEKYISQYFAENTAN